MAEPGVPEWHKSSGTALSGTFQECLGVQSSQQAVPAAWFRSCSCEHLKGQGSKREQFSLCSEMAPLGRWKWKKVRASPTNPETLEKHRDNSTQSQSRLHPGWAPTSDLTLAHAIRSVMDVLTFKRCPSVSSWIGHWMEKIHITGFVKRQLLPNVSLNPSGFLTWSCCGIFSGGLGVRKMLLQFFGWWEVSLLHDHKLSKNLPNSQISSYLLNTSKARQQDLQATGERKVCMFWYVQTGGMNTEKAFL